MSLLFDENLSYRLVTLLAKEYPGSVPLPRGADPRYAGHPPALTHRRPIRSMRPEPDGGIIELMSALLDVEKLLLQMSRAEKAQVLQWIACDIGDAFPGIESIPGVCGGDPVIVRTRIPVWLLEQARRQGTTDAELLQAYPTLRAVDLANAWGYVRSHRAEINMQIEANEASDAA